MNEWGSYQKRSDPVDVLIVCIMTPYSLVDSYQLFKGTYLFTLKMVVQKSIITFRRNLYFQGKRVNVIPSLGPFETLVHISVKTFGVPSDKSVVLLILCCVMRVKQNVS